jgi:hypothetical protein
MDPTGHEMHPSPGPISERQRLISTLPDKNVILAFGFPQQNDAPTADTGLLLKKGADFSKNTSSEKTTFGRKFYNDITTFDE